MPDDIDVEIKGLKETQKKFQQVVKDFKGSPMQDAMRRATLLVERSGKQNAPVDTGRLRASITPEVRVQNKVLQGVVGSVVVYSPFQEFGTKFMKGRFYLRRAIEENAKKIVALIGKQIAIILEK